jgi:heme oxygenase
MNQPLKRIPAPPIVERLRLATRSLHQDLERASPFLQKDFNRGDYLGWLRYMQNFHRRFDPMARQCGVLALMGWDYKPRSHLIADDLRYLGQDGASDETGSGGDLDCLDPQDAMQMAGALYVVEGSSLGGQVLVRLVERCLGDRGVQGKSSLLPHGPDPYPAWGRFMTLLDQLAQGPQASERVVHGACAVFQHLMQQSQRLTTTEEPRSTSFI